MKTSMVKRLFVLGLTSVVLVGAALSPVMAGNKNPVLEIEGMELDVNHDIRANLRALEGKRAMAILLSGKEIPGRIKQVGDHYVRMQGANPKDFMDVLVRIDQIAGIEVQARGYLRDIERAGLKPKQLPE